MNLEMRDCLAVLDDDLHPSSRVSPVEDLKILHEIRLNQKSYFNRCVYLPHECAGSKVVMKNVR